MARYWLGTTDTDPSKVANWSTSTGGAGGASVPDSAQDVTFDANGDNACTFVGNMEFASLDVEAGYTAKLDMATHNLTITDGGDVTLAGGGEFDAGTGTIVMSNGTFDNDSQTTYTDASSKLVMGGTGTLASGGTKDLWSLTITEGAVITFQGHTDVNGVLTVDGTASVNVSRNLNLKGAGTMYIGSAGLVTGLGSLIFNSLGAGAGLITFTSGGRITIGTFEVLRPNPAVVVAPGTFEATTVKFTNTSPTLDRAMTFSAGAYVFTNDIMVTNTQAGRKMTLDNSANADITIQGDVTWTASAGTAEYVAGSGTMTLSGTGDQDIDFGGEATDDLEIIKPVSGDITMVDVDLTLLSSSMAGGLTITAGDVDTAASATIGIGSDLIAENGTFDLGDGTTWTVGGHLDNESVTTFVDGTSTMILTGTATWTTVYANCLYNLEISDGAVITTSGAAQVANSLALDGTLTVGSTAYLLGATTGTGTLGGGSGNVILTGASAGLNMVGGTVAVATLTVSNPSAGVAYLGLNTYASALVKITNVGSGAAVFTFSSGAYVFAGNVEYENTTGGTLTIANDTNDPDLAYQGDVVWDDQVGGASITYTRGLGDTTFSGAAAQSVDMEDQAIEHTVIDKSAGTLTLGEDYTCLAFTGTAGTLDPNGKTVTITNNAWWGSRFDFSTDADALNGCAWVIGGNFQGNAQSMRATAAWDLQVTGTAVVSGAGDVAYSDASGFTEITAYGWTDNNNNTNWDFLPAQSGIIHLPLQFRRQRQAMTAYPN
ncbi:MAG: hypothetical protein GY835_24570 [bacterium]|nr:hypothetical protein [bacterium]